MRVFLFGALLVVLAGDVAGAEKDPRQEAEEKILRAAGLDPQTGALLEFLRKRTITDADRDHVARLIRTLDDDDFAVREKTQKELTALGRKAIPALRRAAESPEQEVRLRCERILKDLGADLSPDVVRAAIRILITSRTSETTAALVGYFPEVDDEALRHEILTALADVAGRDKASARVLVTAATNPNPSRRYAAATCLTGSRSDQDRGVVRRLLADAEPIVRARAAESLLRVNDRSGLPVLFALLEDGPVELAIAADELFLTVAGAGDGNDVLDLDHKDGRRKCRQSWEAWWQKNGAKVDLVRWNATNRPIGRTIICECADPEGISQVWECSSTGKQLWKIPARNPVAVQALAGGRVLVADCVTLGQVVEFDRQGRVLWSHRVSNPVSCQRLPDGNTFIATQSHVLEVTPSGREVFSIRFPKHVHCARIMPNGDLAYLHSKGLLTIVTREGEQVRAIGIGDVSSWGSFEVLAADRFLVCEHAANRVVEIDLDGKLHWECKVAAPNCAVRLPGGNTLVSISKAHQVVEFNPEGKRVWEQATQARPYGVLRR